MGSLQNYNGTVSRGAKKGSSGVEKPIGIYPGQYWDQETGLHYNYFRDYNPLVGRYVQADPIGIKRGQNHLFIGLANNPIRYTDPFGLQCRNCDEELRSCLKDAEGFFNKSENERRAFNDQQENREKASYERMLSGCASKPTAALRATCLAMAEATHMAAKFFIDELDNIMRIKNWVAYTTAQLVCLKQYNDCVK